MNAKNIAEREDSALRPGTDSLPYVSPSAAWIVAFAFAAAWIASGAAGMLGFAIARALSGCALIVCCILGYSRKSPRQSPAIFLGAVLLGFLALSVQNTTANIFAVSMILAVIAGRRRGPDSRLMRDAATSVAALAVFQFAQYSIPFVWHLADGFGAVCGKTVSLLTAHPLNVGATFGGVDFLVLLFCFYATRRFSVAPAEKLRLLITGVALVLVVQIVYLAILSLSETWLSLLPKAYYVTETDSNRLGEWAWQNMFRDAIPWNLPAVAVILHGIATALLLRSVRCKANEAAALKPDLSKRNEAVSLGELGGDAVGYVFPIALFLLVLFLSVGLPKSGSLAGKTITIFSPDGSAQRVPKYDAPGENGFGLLPVFIETLGGKTQISQTLSEEELKQTDLLIVASLQGMRPWPKEQIERVRNYVQEGGKLFIAASNSSIGSTEDAAFNGILKSSETPNASSQVIVSAAAEWEQSQVELAHPTTIGVNRNDCPFGMANGPALKLSFSASPICIGRWGTYTVEAGAKPDSSEYKTGQHLGDLPLCGENDYCLGRIVVFCDLKCLSNDQLPITHDFVGRLLVNCFETNFGLRNIWLQIVGVIAVISLIAFLERRMTVLGCGVFTVLAASSVCGYAHYYAATSRVFPELHNASKTWTTAYIDCSHLEATSSSLWNNYGVGGFARTLARDGFLPLRMNAFDVERLNRCKLFVSIAPLMQYNAQEREAIRGFVEKGGTWLCMAGAQESNALNVAIKEYNLAVPTSPVPPSSTTTEEPNPIGAVRLNFEDEKSCQFFAAWPVAYEEIPNMHFTTELVLEGKRLAVSAYYQSGRGNVAVIADTFFASNQNLESPTNSIVDNIAFWQWFLKYTCEKTTR